MESDVVTLQPLFEFRLDGVGADGGVLGSLQPTALRPTLLSKFARKGFEVPASLFMPTAPPPLAEAGPAAGTWTAQEQV